MEKIKFFLESDAGKDILIILLVILVGLISFELGRLSKEDHKNGLKIEYKGQEAGVIGSLSPNSVNIDSQENANNSNTRSYFASKLGKKYYSITCGAGKTIKQENRIYFNSSSDAIGAGYQLSSACR